MAHPKLEAALEAAKAAQATADQASAWANRMDELTDRLSCLSRARRVVSVNVVNDRTYRVSEETGKAIGQMVIGAYGAELAELRKKLESLSCEGTD